MNNENREIAQDVGIVVSSIFIAVLLVKTGVLTSILASTENLKLLGAFIAGMFFTSIFTTAPAIATLGIITRLDGVAPVAFFGALGAVIGDLVIFRFIRDRLSEHLMELVKHEGAGKRVRMLLKLKFFRWITFLVGGLIIASPLPDEMGIALLGFSKMKAMWFIPLSFTFNFIGILIIGFVARTL